MPRKCARCSAALGSPTSEAGARQKVICGAIRILVYMVKPVSLSDPAFAALRKEKRAGESDSDVVLRLLREARAARKDPLKFLRYRPRSSLSAAEHREFLDRMGEASRDDPWRRS